jgi:hypothetical protein
MDERDRSQEVVTVVAAHQPRSAREASAPARRGQATPAPVRIAPHTRPGDQNALCLETDQA